MGYTHYWERKKKLPKRRFKKAVADCKKVTEWLQKKQGVRIQFEYDVAEKPVFTAEEVRFNGVDEEGCETFWIPQEFQPEAWQREKESGKYFNFCKTRREPYDVCVCACLIVMGHHFTEKEFSYSSDGDGIEEGWAPAERACREVLGYGRPVNTLIELCGGKQEVPLIEQTDSAIVADWLEENGQEEVAAKMRELFVVRTPAVSPP